MFWGNLSEFLERKKGNYVLDWMLFLSKKKETTKKKGKISDCKGQPNCRLLRYYFSPKVCIPPKYRKNFLALFLLNIF